MKDHASPLTVRLQFSKVGAPIEGDPTNGFGESTAFLYIADTNSMGAGLVRLDWSRDTLSTGRSFGAALCDFSTGRGMSHDEALELGRNLFARLFGYGNLKTIWDKVCTRCGTRPMRLELVLPRQQAHFCELPFELLADEQGFLFHGAHATLIRCLADLEAKTTTLQPNAPLLIAWANPAGIDPPLPDADFEAQATSIATAASNAGFRALPTLARAQRHALQQALLGHHEVPLFSLMAHGRPGGGRLVLETLGRTAEDLDAPTLAADLRQANTQVALLWACHAARPHQDLGSVAEQLLTESGNLAAVVAAHGALRADWVAKASQNLFASLARNGDLEQALSAGRRALNASDVHWAALAYYARPRHDRSVTLQQAAEATVERNLETRAQLAAIEDAPQQPRHWVPRPRELTEILAGLRSHRLVTLLGMPGIGKTELAREAAQHAVADASFAVPGGLWIALDKVRSTAGLVARLARWAGLDEADDSESKLLRAIGTKQALWVLDNAEDLLRTDNDAHALRQLVARLLRGCPGLRVLVTSQRSLELARDTAPDTFEYRVQELEGEEPSLALFLAACASPLADAHTAAARELVQLLYGHPSSIVLLAGQVRDGGGNLNALRQRLVATEPADLESLDGAEVVERDRERARRLVASLNLAYQPLAQASPQAAELLAWLGTQPAGLSVAMLHAIFGADTPQYLADLSLHGLLGLQPDSLVLSPPVRWYAEHKLETTVPRERQLELLERTLAALAAFMAACYQQLGKPGAGAVIEAGVREEANLAALVQRFERLRAAAPERSSLLARAVTRWSRVRIHGGTLTEATTLAARALEAAAGAHRGDLAELQHEIGELCCLIDRLADAEGAYQAALDAFTAIDNLLGAANTQRARGELFLHTARLADAETACQAALDTFLALGHRPGTAHAQRARGLLFLRTERLTEAEAALQAALDIFRDLDDRLGAAHAQKALGDLFLRTDRLADAETAFRAALAPFVERGDRLGAAYAHKLLGDLFLRTDRLEQAEAALKAALDIYIAIDDRLGVANAEKSRGDLFLRTDRLAQAEAALQAALNDYLAIGARFGAANAYKSQGDLFLRADRFDEAEAALKAALDIYLAIDNRRGIANTRQALGDLFLRTDRIADAKAALQSALDLHLAIDNQLGAAKTFKTRGDFFLRTNRIADAEAAYKKALDAYIAIDHRLGAAVTHKARGDFFLRTQRLDEAEAAFQAALDAYVKLDNYLGVAQTQRSRAGLFLSSQRLAEAEAAFQAALDAYVVIGDQRGIASTQLARVDFFLLTNRLDDAEAAYQGAFHASLAIDNPLVAAQTRAARGLLTFVRGNPRGAFEPLLQARRELLQLNDRESAAIQLGYLAQVVLASGQSGRAVLLAGRSWQELNAIGDRLGQMHAASTVLEAARQIADEAGVPAAVFAWHVARTLQPAYADNLRPLMEQVLRPEILAAGLPPEALAQVEQRLHQLFEARWQQALAAGDDPLGPLPPISQPPPTSGESSSP